MLSAGTVSKILWHFTGGPRWDKDNNRQEGKPKPPEEAYAALLSILRSKELRVGNYHEVVKVLVSIHRRFDTKTNRMVEELDKLVDLVSAPVCCVADIPIAHLSYHAERYGQFALGFHRDAVLRQGFNPVFYTLHDTQVLQSLYQGLAELQSADIESLEKAANEVDGLECEHGHKVDVSSGDSLYEIGINADMVKDGVNLALKKFEEFLAFVKTFNRDEFQTIYCEREWRSTQTFDFSYGDIAMVVLPKRGEDEHFRRFTAQDSSDLELPRSVPIVPWEDLVEH